MQEVRIISDKTGCITRGTVSTNEQGPGIVIRIYISPDQFVLAPKCYSRPKYADG